jgi:hypothetical protein
MKLLQVQMDEDLYQWLEETARDLGYVHTTGRYRGRPNISQTVRALLLAMVEGDADGRGE